MWRSRCGVEPMIEGLQRRIAVRADGDQLRALLLGDLREPLRGAFVHELRACPHVGRAGQLERVRGDGVAALAQRVEQIRRLATHRPGVVGEDDDDLGAERPGEPQRLGERGARAVGSVVADDRAAPPSAARPRRAARSSAGSATSGLRRKNAPVARSAR